MCIQSQMKSTNFINIHLTKDLMYSLKGLEMYPESWEDKKIMSSDKWPIICPSYVMINYYDENEVIITTFIRGRGS